MTHKDLQRRFLTHSKNICRDRNNSYGRCPFCRKESILDIRLSGSLKDANVNVLIKHMNLRHLISLALLERSGKFRID